VVLKRSIATPTADTHADIVTIPEVTEEQNKESDSVQLTVREQKEARKAERIQKEMERIAEKQAQQKMDKKAKAEAKKMVDKQIAEAKVNTPAVDAKSTMTKKELDALVLRVLSQVTIAGKTFWSCGRSSADVKVEMIERMEKQVRTVRQVSKTVDICTTRIGPMPMMSCSRISERFKKMGVRNVILEQEGSWFLEYDSGSGHCSQSINDRVTVVLDELIKTETFADCPPAMPLDAHIRGTFNVKVSASAEKEKQFKKKGKKERSDDMDFRVARF
jgi:hypothetical protein